jgi:hypothetical protein
MQTITTIGLDIAKSVFQVHGVDAGGQAVIRRQLKRRYVLAFFQKLGACSRTDLAWMTAIGREADVRRSRTPVKCQEQTCDGSRSLCFGVEPSSLLRPTAALRRASRCD